MNGCQEIVRDVGTVTVPPPSTFREQFGNPTGWLGWIVGQMMALKNGARSRWVLSLADLHEESRVLEIGFGPGADVARIAQVATRGIVAGVDPSAVMRGMAERRNRAGVRRGTVCLRTGFATDLPFVDASFDRVVSINSVQFWDDLRVGLCEVARVLRPGGVAIIAIEPRNRGATAETSRLWGEKLSSAMTSLGLRDVRVETMDSTDVPAVAAIGVEPVTVR